MAEVKIKKIFEGVKKIALFGHVQPDGDCIGSMLGLGSLLEKLGKKVSYFTPTTPSIVFDFLPGIKKIQSEFDYGKYDLLVFVDFSGYDRIKKFTLGYENYFDSLPLVIIDHHLSDVPPHSGTIKNIESMSTAEIVFEHSFKWRPKLFTPQIATYFYLGLTTDSGNFFYDVDHERIFGHALRLVKLGANKTLIINKLFRSRSLNLIKFTQVLLERIQQKGDLLYSYYDAKELKTYGVDQEEASYPLTIIQDIAGPRVVLILKKIDENVRGSLRSKAVEGHKKIVDCNALAHALGGGGHKAAAGFSVVAEGKFEDQIKKIVNKILKMI